MVLPRAPSVASSLGENASPAQSVAAYGADTVATVPPTPVSVARTACSAQLDALRMNPGRSSVSVNDRIDTGTPPTSRGSGDVCTVRPPSGRSLIDAITVTVPRSTGPTLPGRTIWNPARPPSCGPVRYTSPLSATGASPAPATAATLPTRVPTGRPLSEPARPGGRSAVTCERSSAPSGRVISIATDPAGRPAAVEAADTFSPGANAGSAQPWSIVKLAGTVFGAVPLQGVRVALSAFSPQVGGLFRTAFAPPLNCRANAVNGTCGRLSKIVVIWPVAGLSLTSPASLTCTPGPSITT